MGLRRRALESQVLLLVAEPCSGSIGGARSQPFLASEQLFMAGKSR